EGENRGVGADPERQRQRRDGREARRLGEQAGTELQVVKKCRHNLILDEQPICVVRLDFLPAYHESCVTPAVMPNERPAPARSPAPRATIHQRVRKTPSLPARGKKRAASSGPIAGGSRSASG